MKKLISVLLAAIMLVSCFSVMAFATEEKNLAYVSVVYRYVDENGNEIYYETSDGYWEKTTYEY